MTSASPVTFNVIFVRHTVGLLRVFLHSLRTRTTTARFRLVSNGCTRAEARILREFCRDHERFAFLELSPATVLPHQQALNELLARERSPYFAFMDSDCYVTGDPFTDVVTTLDGSAALFSGEPTWRAHMSPRLPRGYVRLSDQYRQAHDGRCVGSSYLAVYDRHALVACMEETGVSFWQYHWEQLPAPVQSELTHAGLRLLWYDNCKVVNILLGLRGHLCTYAELPQLWHIGAVSVSVTSRARRRLIQGLQALGALQPLRDAFQRVGLRAAPSPDFGNEEQDAALACQSLQLAVSDHFVRLLRSLEAAAPVPTRFEHPDEAVVSAVGVIEGHLRQLHQEWSS